jgi:hypothetical protein
MPVIGFLQSGSPGTTAHMGAAFHRGLTLTGYNSTYSDRDFDEKKPSRADFPNCPGTAGLDADGDERANK